MAIPLLAATHLAPCPRGPQPRQIPGCLAHCHVSPRLTATQMHSQHPSPSRLAWQYTLRNRPNSKMTLLLGRALVSSPPQCESRMETTKMRGGELGSRGSRGKSCLARYNELVAAAAFAVALPRSPNARPLPGDDAWECEGSGNVSAQPTLRGRCATCPPSSGKVHCLPGRRTCFSPRLPFAHDRGRL